MDLFETIRNRRSIRKYHDQSLDPEDLNKVLEAGRLAPSANNRQEWRFVVVQDADMRQKLSVAACGQKFVAEASAVIACCTVESEKIMTCGHPTYAIDLAIVIDHMTLAAAALGLGTCWIGAFYEDQVRELLNIPESVRVVELMTLGHPAESPGPRPRKSISEIVMHETWQ